MKTTTIFAIRCFIDGKRTKTHELTNSQARTFRKAALHLARFLKKSYEI
jgi:hypothetical protein